MKNKTLTKNMPNVKWNLLPPRRGPNPQGVNDVKMNNKTVRNKWSLVRSHHKIFK